MNERINLNVDLTLISKKICQNYNLGEFISNNIITVGYEDFNYILVSSTGKYCIKIFNKNELIMIVKNILIELNYLTN